MGKRIMIAFLFILVCGLLAAAAAQAGTSSNGYTLNWNVIGGGAGPTMSGDGYTLNATLGQTAIGWSENDHQLGSGFWYGAMAAEHNIFLPLVLRNYS
jgi:hypothetical protein